MGRATCCSVALACVAVAALALLPARVSCAVEVIDRVVAVVDDKAITLSEFREEVDRYRASLPQMTDEDVLEAMINTTLLVERARAMRLEGQTRDDLVREYMEVRIRPRVVIREEQVREFYGENRESLGGKDYVAVRDQIESYLAEKETNRLLKEHIEELKANAIISRQLKDLR